VDDTLDLRGLLAGTPEADLLDLVINDSANADGIDYRGFLQAGRRALASCAAEDLPALRERLCEALRDRARNGGFDPPLIRPFVKSLLGGVPWTALHAAAAALYGPQARLAMLCAQLATSVLPRLSQGSWQAGVAALHLLPLDALLPSLRSSEEIDDLVQNLPRALREGLWELHTALRDVEQAVAPPTPATMVLVALAAALWKLYEHVSPPVPAMRGGNSSTLVGLPLQARCISQWNQRFGALFAPIAGPDAAQELLRADIAGYTELKQRLDGAAASGMDDQSALRALLESMQQKLAHQREQDPASANDRPLRVLRDVLTRYVAPTAATDGLCTQLSRWVDEHLQQLRAGLPGPGTADDIHPHVAGSLFRDDRAGTRQARPQTMPPTEDTGGTGLERPEPPGVMLDLPVRALAGALTEPGALSPAVAVEADPSGVLAASLRAPDPPPVAAVAPESGDDVEPPTLGSRVAMWLGHLPDIGGDGQESAVSDYLGLQIIRTDGKRSTVRAELAALWADQLGQQAAAGVARGTLSERAAALVSRLASPDAAGLARFGMAFELDGERRVTIPGAVVISGRSTDPTPRDANGPIVVLLPGLGLLEYDAAGLDGLVSEMDLHPSLRAALYGLIPLEHLQPRTGCGGTATLTFPPLDPDCTGEEVVDRILQGGIEIQRASARRGQSVKPLADLVGPFFGTPGIVEQALSQLSEHGLLRAPVRDAARILPLATTWMDYLRALVHSPITADLQSPQDHDSGDQVRRHVAGRLQQKLETLGITESPENIRVRWQEQRFRPEMPGLPRNPSGAVLLPPLQHDVTLVDLALDNMAFVNVPFAAQATAIDAEQQVLASLTPAVMREWIRGLDLESSYQRYLQQQFDTTQRGGVGMLRLRAFKTAFPARVALEEQLALAHGGRTGPQLLRQILQHPASHAVEHAGRVEQVRVGPLVLDTHFANDEAVVLTTSSELPGTLAVRTPDGQVQAYVAGLSPSPFLYAADESRFSSLLETAEFQDWLQRHVPGSKHRHDLRDRSTWSSLSVTAEPGDSLEACYRRWVGHLQREADDLMVSDHERLVKDIVAVLATVYEFAENLLPARLEAASVLLRTLAPLLVRGESSSAARALAWETAMLRLFSSASIGSVQKIGRGRSLLAGSSPSALGTGMRPGYIRSAQGDYRIATDATAPRANGAVLLDPASGQPAGGMARYDAATSRWRVEPAHRSAAEDYRFLAEPLDDRQITHMSSQGNGVHDLDGSQFVRIEGQWFRSEVRPELGGGRYLLAPGGRVRSDLLLARRDNAWVVTRPARGGLRGGQPDRRPGGHNRAGEAAELAIMKRDVPEAALLDDAELKRVLAVHGPIDGTSGAALRRDLRDRAHDHMLGRIAAGRTGFDARGFGETGKMAQLCALVHDPLLGQGRRIELYTGSAATGQRRLVIGDGTSALLKIDIGRKLPTSNELLTLLGPTAVARSLGLSEGTASSDLLDAFAAHLQKAVQQHAPGVRAALRKLADDHDAASPAVAALQLQFGIDRGLAEEVLQRQPASTDAALRYQRPASLVETLADAAGKGNERGLRKAILEGRAPSLDAVQLLHGVLSELLPAWKVTSDLRADGSPQLHLALQPTGRRSYTLAFEDDGVHVQGHAKPYAKWEQAVGAVVGNDVPKDLQRPAALASAVAALLRGRDVNTPTARLPEQRNALMQTAAQPACAPGMGLCPASARRPDDGDYLRQLQLRDTAVKTRRDIADALEQNLRQKRDAATAWLEKTDPKLRAGSGSDEDLFNLITVLWPSRRARQRELEDFVQAFQTHEALPKANILVASIALRVDGQPVEWSPPAFVSSHRLSGRHGFAQVDTVRAESVLVPARLRPGHEHLAHPGESDFEAPESLMRGVLKDTYPFGRYVVEPRAHLGGRHHADEGPTLVRIRDESHLRSLLRTHLTMGDTAPKVGDHVYLSTIRRCTESQFLQELSGKLSAALPGFWTQPDLRQRVTGSITLFSDRVPCLGNCQALMRAASEALPQVDFKIGYGDPPGRGGVIVPHVQPPRIFPLP